MYLTQTVLAVMAVSTYVAPVIAILNQLEPPIQAVSIRVRQQATSSGA